jgi:hypothetical protein
VTVHAAARGSIAILGSSVFFLFAGVEPPSPALSRIFRSQPPVPVHSAALSCPFPVVACSLHCDVVTVAQPAVAAGVRLCVVVHQDEGSPFVPTAPLVFTCEDDSLWNILIYGMERVCDDIANDCVTCSCVIDSAFWLLTKPEQCSEACRLFIHLLTGVNIVYVTLPPALIRGPLFHADALRVFVAHRGMRTCCSRLPRSCRPLCMRWFVIRALLAPLLCSPPDALPSSTGCFFACSIGCAKQPCMAAVTTRRVICS